ncbi:MAG: tRNA (adenosine(37)-N6)-threonylcarbamoyltransferase complex dimerization subunit type 1 TsaB [Bacteroidetes bacterium]|nr:MAG: tRNA (adenosine(37)-N6)-threonylcarbamoyltransferase complex dimerization subunit type 1 TsaB [Bacteroidota bacterium]
MSLILHIDTALEKAYVGLARDGELLAEFENIEQKEHASFVQPAIKEMLEQLNLKPVNLDAVGVTIGPGSYTGLRVGMASAKGICYALKIPLITIGTLELYASAALDQFPGYDAYCPMIDARRNEVFTAVYDSTMVERMAPHALVLDPESFERYFNQFGRVIFFGNGSEKFKSLAKSFQNADFETIFYNGKHLASKIYANYCKKIYSDLAYSEPLYAKEFHSTISKT